MYRDPSLGAGMQLPLRWGGGCLYKDPSHSGRDVAPLGWGRGQLYRDPSPGAGMQLPLGWGRGWLQISPHSSLREKLKRKSLHPIDAAGAKRRQQSGIWPRGPDLTPRRPHPTPCHTAPPSAALGSALAARGHAHTCSAVPGRTDRGLGRCREGISPLGLAQGPRGWIRAQCWALRTPHPVLGPPHSLRLVLGPRRSLPAGEMLERGRSRALRMIQGFKALPRSQSHQELPLFSWAQGGLWGNLVPVSWPQGRGLFTSAAKGQTRPGREGELDPVGRGIGRHELDHGSPVPDHVKSLSGHLSEICSGDGSGAGLWPVWCTQIPTSPENSHPTPCNTGPLGWPWGPESTPPAPESPIPVPQHRGSLLAKREACLQLFELVREAGRLQSWAGPAGAGTQWGASPADGHRGEKPGPGRTLCTCRAGCSTQGFSSAPRHQET